MHLGIGRINSQDPPCLVKPFHFLSGLGLPIGANELWSVPIGLVALVPFFRLEEDLALVAAEQGHVVNLREGIDAGLIR